MEKIKRIKKSDREKANLTIDPQKLVEEIDKEIDSKINAKISLFKDLLYQESVNLKSEVKNQLGLFKKELQDNEISIPVADIEYRLKYLEKDYFETKRTNKILIYTALFVSLSNTIALILMTL